MTRPLSRVRVIALGSPHGGDDELALSLGRALAEQLEGLELVLAGRPGPGLVDLLDTDAPVLLLDVVNSGAPVGTIIELSLTELRERAAAVEQLSSHGFGPAEALRLAAALGRELPRGTFLGVEGGSFELGAGLSPAVSARLGELETRARAAIEALRRPPPGSVASPAPSTLAQGRAQDGPMHESGLIQSLLRTALAEAERRGAELAGVEVRLGVLAGGSPEHLREHFELELERLGVGPITLDITADPDYPGGVEIVGVELRER